MMKKIFAVALCALMLLAFAGCATTTAPVDADAEGEKTDAPEGEKEDETPAGDLAYIQKNGKMIIGYTIYEPMNYEEEGKLTGFDTEFAEAVCKKLGVEPEFVEIDWDNKFLELEAKSIDCIWNGMTITDEVNLNTNCTKAYVKNAQVVVMKKDKIAEYKTAESLKGLKFAAEAGSAGEAAILDNELNEKYVAASAQTDALLEVLSGSADACVIDITMAKAMLGEGTSYADLAYGIELTSEEYGIGFRKDSDVTEKVNAVMDELKKDGTLTALAEKYSLNLAF